MKTLDVSPLSYLIALSLSGAWIWLAVPSVTGRKSETLSVFTPSVELKGMRAGLIIRSCMSHFKHTTQKTNIITSSIMGCTATMKNIVFPGLKVQPAPGMGLSTGLGSRRWSCSRSPPCSWSHTFNTVSMANTLFSTICRLTSVPNIRQSDGRHTVCQLKLEPAHRQYFGENNLKKGFLTTTTRWKQNSIYI